MLEVLHIFTRLGLTSFGGPTAHLGYFRDEFVEKRKWLTDDEYADLVALCQFMPGPASSQVGMAIGLKRAGYGGMLAAFVGFTLPSVVLMVAFALGVARLGDISDAGWLAGFKAAAVAVVAQASCSPPSLSCYSCRTPRPRSVRSLRACSWPPSHFRLSTPLRPPVAPPPGRWTLLSTSSLFLSAFSLAGLIRLFTEIVRLLLTLLTFQSRA